MYVSLETLQRAVGLVDSLAELEIASLLARYARGVDTKDWELYRSVFTEDALKRINSARQAILGANGHSDPSLLRSRSTHPVQR